MKRFLKILLALVLMFSFNVQASNFATLTEMVYAKVTEIVDGEAFVATLSNGQPMLVKMIGVDTEGFNDSVTYLNNILLGSSVWLSPDTFLRASSGRWNLAYVYKGNTLINSELLTTGHAKLNNSHMGAYLYIQLQYAELSARNAKIGIWNETPGFRPVITSSYTGSGVNINTASASRLSTDLNISRTVADRIVSYRNHNPFKTIYEIKFVGGFTKKMFDDNRNNIVVSTNINIATEDELITLGDITSSEARRIVEYRNRQQFTNTSQLYTESLISRSKYESIEPFVSVSTLFTITATVPEDTRVNINTANAAQLITAGFSSSQADRIVEHRTEYSYKTIEELGRIFTFTRNDIDRIAGNLSIYTDINTAIYSELQSLLGSDATNALVRSIEGARPFRNTSDLRRVVPDTIYNRILPHIYVDSYETSYININTASRAELLDWGFSANAASNVINRQPSITTSRNIPRDALEFGSRISLYTNINKASRQELRSLDINLTESIASQIINYRDDQPFGDIDEIDEFFSSISQSDLYFRIRNFIVVR